MNIKWPWEIHLNVTLALLMGAAYVAKNLFYLESSQIARISTD